MTGSPFVILDQHPSFEVFRSNLIGPWREEFDRPGLDGGNKSTVDEPSDDGRVAILPMLSTGLSGRPIFDEVLIRRTIVPDGAKGIGDMQQLRSMLRSAPSRIGRQFKLIVAIAAASLPAAGA